MRWRWRRRRRRCGIDASASDSVWAWAWAWKGTDGEEENMRGWENMRELIGVWEKKRGRDWQRDEREKNKKFIKIITHLSVGFHIWELTVYVCQIFWDLEHLVRDVFWRLICQILTWWECSKICDIGLIFKIFG